MSSAETTEKKAKAKLFDMILSSPGMGEECKLNVRITRQNALILARLIETGFFSSKKIVEDDILGSLNEQTVEEFKVMHEDMLKKTGLTDLYQKLKDM